MANFVNLMDIIYPVGSIYITTSAISPADSIGGTWVKIEDCLLAATGDAYGKSRGYSGNDMITKLAIPDHQHKVMGWNSTSATYAEVAFWHTNATTGNQWNLLSVGGQIGGDSGGNLWTKGTWRIDDNGMLVDKQQSHIPYHYSMNVYTRTA